MSHVGKKTCDKDVVTWLVYRVHALRTLARVDRQHGYINESAFVSLKGHCIEFKYYADGIHSGLTYPAGLTIADPPG